MNFFLQNLIKLRPVIFIDQLIYRIDEDNVMATSAQLTFSLILSIFPFIIVFLNILSYTPLIKGNILSDAIYYLPAATQKIILDFTYEIAETSSQSLLSLAAILWLWSAASGLQAVIKAINRAYDYREDRSFIRLKFLSLFFTLALMILLILVFLSLIFGEFIANRIFSLLGTSLLLNLWEYIRIIIPLLYMILIFALLYKYSPSKYNEISLLSTLPGAIFTTLGWMLISILFSYYVNNFGRYAITYGSLVGIILLLIWLYISSTIIVIGGEINATREFLRTNGYKWHKDKSFLAHILRSSN